MTKFNTIYKTGQKLNITQGYHMDSRIFKHSFEVLKETSKRTKVRITKQIANGNDWRQPFIEVVEEKYLSFNALLKAQYDLCEFAQSVEIAEA